MWSVTLGQTEGGAEVAREVWNGLDVLEEGGVDGLLVGLAVGGELLLLQSCQQFVLSFL